MDNFIFYGCDKPNLLEQMYVIDKLRKLNKNYFHYGFRKLNDGKYVYFYGTRTKVFCETVQFCDGCKYPNEHRLGHCDFKYDKKNKNFYISYITVWERYRGNGIGDAMLDYTIEVAKKLGAQSVTLDRLCVFTNGEECVNFYGSEKAIEDLMDLKLKGKPVVDKNLKFYTKHGFLKDYTRKPSQPHLVPMVLKGIKPANPKAVKTKVFYLKLRKKEVMQSDERTLIYKRPIDNLSEDSFSKRYNLNPKKIL